MTTADYDNREAEYDSNNGNGEAVTVAVAAKALGITRRTVERYMESGKLGKVKEGSRVYVRMADVRSLRRSMKECDNATSEYDSVASVASSSKSGNGGKQEDTIVLPLPKYNELISEIAALKKQAVFLLEYKAGLEAKDTELRDARQKVLEAQVERAVSLEQVKATVRELRKMAEEAEEKTRRTSDDGAALAVDNRRLGDELSELRLRNEALVSEIEERKKPFWKRMLNCMAGSLKLIISTPFFL